MNAALGVAGWNAVSRGTGFVRTLVVAGALGTTFLGNTYHQSNLVSNVTFELVAVGMLSAPLVPSLVRLRASAAETTALLSALWGLALIVLGGLALAICILGRPLMDALTGSAPDLVATQQVELGRYLLWFFAPQLVLYGLGALATGVLHSHDRFALAAAAPVANNLIVIATMVVFVTINEASRTLPVSADGRLVLGLGTTLGVAVMSVLPAIGAAKVGGGAWLRPRFDIGSPEVRRVGRQGAWAGVATAGHQLLLLATLVLANRVAGGVVATQVGFAVLLLPFALVAHPVITTGFPRLARLVGATFDFRAEVRRVLKILAGWLIPASLVLGLVVAPLAGRVRFGSIDARGAGLLGAVIAAYAFGLLGYAIVIYLARAFAALDDARTAGLVTLAGAGLGILAMSVTSAAFANRGAIVGIALSHALALTVIAVTMGLILLRRLDETLAAQRAGAVT